LKEREGKTQSKAQAEHRVQFGNVLFMG